MLQYLIMTLWNRHNQFYILYLNIILETLIDQVMFLIYNSDYGFLDLMQKADKVLNIIPKQRALLYCTVICTQKGETIVLTYLS